MPTCRPKACTVSGRRVADVRSTRSGARLLPIARQDLHVSSPPARRRCGAAGEGCCCDLPPNPYPSFSSLTALSAFEARHHVPESHNHLAARPRRAPGAAGNSTLASEAACAAQLTYHAAGSAMWPSMVGAHWLWLASLTCCQACKRQPQSRCGWALLDRISLPHAPHLCCINRTAACGGRDRVGAAAVAVGPGRAEQAQKQRHPAGAVGGAAPHLAGAGRRASASPHGSSSWDLPLPTVPRDDHWRIAGPLCGRKRGHHQPGALYTSVVNRQATVPMHGAALRLRLTGLAERRAACQALLVLANAVHVRQLTNQHSYALADCWAGGGHSFGGDDGGGGPGPGGLRPGHAQHGGPQGQGCSPLLRRQCAQAARHATVLHGQTQKTVSAGSSCLPAILLANGGAFQQRMLPILHRFPPLAAAVQLDGEVVVLDGVAYQQTADGTSHVVDAAAKVKTGTLGAKRDSGASQQVTFGRGCWAGYRAPLWRGRGHGHCRQRLRCSCCACCWLPFGLSSRPRCLPLPNAADPNSPDK